MKQGHRPRYEGGGPAEEGGVEFHNMDHFFFTEDEIFFWVRISMNEKGMEEYGEVTQGWFERMRIVERQ